MAVVRSVRGVLEWFIGMLTWMGEVFQVYASSIHSIVADGSACSEGVAGSSSSSGCNDVDTLGCEDQISEKSVIPCSSSSDNTSISEDAGRVAESPNAGQTRNYISCNGCNNGAVAAISSNNNRKGNVESQNDVECSVTTTVENFRGPSSVSAIQKSSGLNGVTTRNFTNFRNASTGSIGTKSPDRVSTRKTRTAQNAQSTQIAQNVTNAHTTEHRDKETFHCDKNLPASARKGCSGGDGDHGDSYSVLGGYGLNKVNQQNSPSLPSQSTSVSANANSHRNPHVKSRKTKQQKKQHCTRRCKRNNYQKRTEGLSKTESSHILMPKHVSYRHPHSNVTPSERRMEDVTTCTNAAEFSSVESVASNGNWKDSLTSAPSLAFEEADYKPDLGNAKTAAAPTSPKKWSNSTYATKHCLHFLLFRCQIRGCHCVKWSVYYMCVWKCHQSRNCSCRISSGSGSLSSSWSTWNIRNRSKFFNQQCFRQCHCIPRCRTSHDFSSSSIFCIPCGGGASAE